MREIEDSATKIRAAYDEDPDFGFELYPEYREEPLSCDLGCMDCHMTEGCDTYARISQ